MNEVIREFVIETHENLSQLDLDLITLEKHPSERETLSRVFRTFHTIKGTAGFLGLQKLQAIAHAAENLLSRLRDGDLTFGPEIATGLLAAVDAVRQMLAAVEKSMNDGDTDFASLLQTLERLHSGAANANVQNSAGKAPTSVVLPPEPAASQATEPKTDSAPPQSRTPTVMAAAPSLVDRPIDAHEPRGGTVSDSSIRVDVGLLDKLMNLVGELVLARNQIVQMTNSAALAPLLGTVQRLNLLTTELQTGVMKTRMQAIHTLWNKFPRVVRDLAMECGKQARIEMQGQETELDKSIIEAIRDPLTHLVRNAVDHGFELPATRVASGKPAEGRLALHAFHEGGKVIVEITDDGCGIDPQKIRAKAVQARLVPADQADRMSDNDLVNLIFLPGFSTAERVTQYSGRGVGMDVVRTHIERIGGSVTIESKLGRGTTVRMKIPLTLAIIPALTITSGAARYAIPQANLLELVRLDGDAAGRGVEWIHGAPVYRLRGNLLPLVFLRQVLNQEQQPHRTDARRGEDSGYVVVLQADEHQFGLVVDEIHDTEEIVVKPLQKQLKRINVYAGATIMGDGAVALILDVVGLAQRAGLLEQVRERIFAERPSHIAAASRDRQAVVLFATRQGDRLAVPLADVARLEEFPISALERVGPIHVVQYRGELLPLIDVSRQLRRRTSKRERVSPGRRSPVALGPTVQVIVYAGLNRRLGLVVDRIIDIAEDSIVTRAPAQRTGVSFTAVIQERATEFLDIEALFKQVDPDVFVAAQHPEPSVAMEA